MPSCKIRVWETLAGCRGAERVLALTLTLTVVATFAFASCWIRSYWALIGFYTHTVSSIHDPAYRDATFYVIQLRFARGRVAISRTELHQLNLGSAVPATRFRSVDVPDQVGNSLLLTSPLPRIRKVAPGIEVMSYDYTDEYPKEPIDPSYYRHDRAIAAPAWPVFLLLAVPSFFIFRTWRRRRGRRIALETGRCPACNYDTRAISERCSECGGALA